jgi:2-methylcitrate dehydratase PrpD
MASTDAALTALCEWTAACAWADIPPATRQRSAEILADDLAAVLDAAEEPEVAALRARGLARGGRGAAALMAAGLPRTDRLTAASCNGVAACWVELDGGFRPVPCHAGIYVWPALLAEAEATGASFGEVLRAHALAYEIVTRIALAFRFGTPKLHAHAAFASLGPRGHMVEGVLIRNGWVGAGAACGLLAADYAEAGIGGAAHSVADVYGTLLGGAGDAAQLTADLGARWSVAQGYHKTFACCQHGHPTVDALLQIRARDAVAPAEVSEIVVETHPLALALDNAAPATTLAGKFSLQHIAASTLKHGTADAAAFGAASLTEPEVARLRQAVRIAPWENLPEPPHDRPSRVTVALRDGRRLTAECLSAPGNPDRPIGAAALAAKLAAAAKVLPGLPRLAGRTPTEAAAARRWQDVLAELAEG